MTPAPLPEGVIRLWKEYGYRPFQDAWTEQEPDHKGPEDCCEYLAVPASSPLAAALRGEKGEPVASLVERVERFAFALASNPAWYENAVKASHAGEGPLAKLLWARARDLARGVNRAAPEGGKEGV